MLPLFWDPVQAYFLKLKYHDINVQGALSETCRIVVVNTQGGNYEITM
jgi:hypothetical protein